MGPEKNKKRIWDFQKHKRAAKRDYRGIAVLTGMVLTKRIELETLLGGASTAMPKEKLSSHVKKKKKGREREREEEVSEPNECRGKLTSIIIVIITTTVLRALLSFCCIKTRLSCTV